MSSIPAIRIHSLNECPARPTGDFVLYWMIGARRLRSNFALDRAIGWAKELSKPLVVLEPLRCDYPYASERCHHFVIEGMAEHSTFASGKAIRYLPYIERKKSEGRGMMRAYARHASVVVTDLSAIPWLAGMARAAARAADVRFEAVDSLGLLPLRASAAPFKSAHSYRRHLQKTVPAHLERVPTDDPLERLELPPAEIPDDLARRWPLTTSSELQAPASLIASLPLDRVAGKVPLVGGHASATAKLRRFLANGLPRYVLRSHPDQDAASGLSPWLHFGHIGVHEVFRALTKDQEWTPERISKKPNGSKEGYWNMSAHADAFLDELVTWRELGHIAAHHRSDVATWEGVPDWARKSLEAHAGDWRPALYSDEQLIAAETGDQVWNAAQRELMATGRIQNYLRMIWGKRLIEWTRDPAEAFSRLIVLNDRFAIDGRDPNSWANIGWVFGAYDRPWGPERPIYGNIRYMSSELTKKKLEMRNWFARWSG